VKRHRTGFRKKARHIVLLLLDVDGVLTDGRIIVDDRGVETKNFHVRDGQGIALLMRGGIDVGFLTARASRSVSRRAKELGVTLVRQRVVDKLAAYEEIKASRNLQDKQIAYMGDDIIDLPILRKAGLALTVADAWPGLRAAVDVIATAAGGAGAVREIAELVLKAQSKWDRLIHELTQA
jgi:3-deoxy-D-manno-octulosonate 8-phosphate phosphatase (KDO 8-P phosphatase)